MKTKFIALTLCAAVLITPMVKTGEHDNHAQKNSNARRISFFLLHGASFLGGLGATINGISTLLLCRKVRFANPNQEEQILNDFTQKLKKTGLNEHQSDMLAQSLMATYKNNPTVVPLSGTIALGGLAATIYGFQGLVKDLVSLFK